jgi:hypothetical protein
MATNNTVNFTINLNGNAYNGVVQLSNAVNQTLNPAIRESESLFKKVGNACFWLNSIFDLVGRTVGRVVGKLSDFEKAGRAQAEAETKLAQVMRNTMGDDIVRRYGNVEAALKREREAVENLNLSFKELPGKLNIPVGLKPEVTGTESIAKAFDGIRDKAMAANRNVDVGIQLKPKVTGEKEVANAFDSIRHIPVPSDREVRIGLNMRPEVTGMKDVAEAFDGIREKAMAASRSVDVGIQLKPKVTGEKEVANAFDRIRHLPVPGDREVRIGLNMRPEVTGMKDMAEAFDGIREKAMAAGRSVDVGIRLKPEVTGLRDVTEAFDGIRDKAMAANRSVDVGIQLKPKVTGEKEVANAFDRIRHLPVPGDREVRIGLNMRPEVTGMKDMAEAFDGIREKAMAANRTVDVGVKLKTTVTGEKEMLKTFDRVRSLTDKAPKGVDMDFDLRPVVRGEEEVVNAMDRIRNLSKPVDVKVPVEIQPTVLGADAFETAMERIRKLTADQQRKGVIGDEIQIAGVQELAKNVTQLSTLEKLIPVMNDLTAQQQGYNATQEGAVGWAKMLGKAMQGNVKLLERSGYQFSEAQENIMKTGTEAQRAATLAEVLSQKVGGVNEALANTPEGRVVQLGNAYGDLQERLGGLWANLKDTLFPVFDGLIQRADGLIDVIEEKMGAVKEWILGAVEWLSGVWDSVKEPVMNTVSSLWGSLRTIVGNIVNTITGIVRNHSTVIRGILGFIGWSIRTVGKVLAWLSGLVTGFVNFVSNNAPLVLGFAGALGILTLATKAQAIKQVILNGATAFGIGLGSILGKVILFVNGVMAANPVYWIIAGVVALAGVITFLAIKVKGWGSLWEAVWNFSKHSFLAFVETIKLRWTAMINGLMIGLDKIKEVWYKFRKAVGIGDESENDAALAKIAQDVKARQEKIAEGAGKVQEHLKAAADSWKGVHLEWDKKVKPKDAVAKIKADLGITDQSAVTNILNDQSSGDTELNSELSDASTKISSGGKNIKNINITINDGLVHGVQNYFNSSDDNPDTASDFMWRLANALQLVVNDVNYD